MQDPYKFILFFFIITIIKSYHNFKNFILRVPKIYMSKNRIYTRTLKII